jgi:hypothetical protein
MQLDRARVAGAGMLLALGILAACDAEPTEPTFSAADIGTAFARLPVDGDPDEGPIYAACPAGGGFTFEHSTSVEQDGDRTIRRMQWVRRYEDCAMRRLSTVIVANGELTWSGEAHLTHEDAKWPNGVLYQKGHQVGTLTMAYDGSDVRTCEYDHVEESQPAVGFFSYKGTVCGISIDRKFHIPL